MKILVLTSGRCCAGINIILNTLYKKFKGNLYCARAGFKGLINNDIINISQYKLKNNGGSVIKSSICPYFTTEEGLEKAFNNAKRFDYLVILGGRGSLEGANKLAIRGIKVIFIPCSIANDIKESDYCLGFDSAVKSSLYFINATMNYLESFNMCGIFEIAGEAAKKIFKQLRGDYLILRKEDINWKTILEKLEYNYHVGKASCIIIKENSIEIDDFLSNLAQKTNTLEYRSYKLMEIQAGANPTNFEKDIASMFAKKTISAIIENSNSSIVTLNDGDIKLKEFN